MFMNVPVFSYTYTIYVTINRGLEFVRGVHGKIWREER